MNPERVQRIYREEGPEMRTKEAKRLRDGARTQLDLRVLANHVWNEDFKRGRLASGGNFRTSSLLDSCSEDVLRGEVDTSLAEEQVAQVKSSKPNSEFSLLVAAPWSSCPR